MRQINSPFDQLIKGAIAGLLATVPMTIFMRSAWRLLPKREKYPLPPRLITRRLTKETGVDDQLDADQLTWLTLTLTFCLELQQVLYMALSSRAYRSTKTSRDR